MKVEIDELRDWLRRRAAQHHVDGWHERGEEDMAILAHLSPQSGDITGTYAEDAPKPVPEGRGPHVFQGCCLVDSADCRCCADECGKPAVHPIHASSSLSNAPEQEDDHE